MFTLFVVPSIYVLVARRRAAVRVEPRHGRAAAPDLGESDRLVPASS
jgi:hypothetical protein